MDVLVFSLWIFPVTESSLGISSFFLLKVFLSDLLILVLLPFIFLDLTPKLILKLKLQYFGHLLQRSSSLEKTQRLGKIKGRRRRGDRK